MKTICIILVFVHALFARVNAQSFEPDNYLKNVQNPNRIFKSHIPTDSLILQRVSDPVELSDSSLSTLIARMYRTVTDSLSRGVGIAAPQLGVSKRVILVERLDKSVQTFEAYLNPCIIQYTKLKDLRTEGCLSIDSFRCEVERPYAILLTYFTVYGEFRIEMVEGFTARIFQHEIDHLNGILFTERKAK